MQLLFLNMIQRLVPQKFLLFGITDQETGYWELGQGSISLAPGPTRGQPGSE